MEIVKFNDKEHYEALRMFWAQYDWEAPELDCLPRTGFVAQNETGIIGACFYYKTNSKMAMMDWLIADKESDKEHRNVAVLMLIEKIKTELKDAGVKIIYTITANKKIVETYKRMGFQVMEEGVVSMAHSTNKNLDFLR